MTTVSKRVVISINTAWNIYNFRAGLIRALKAEGYEVLSAAPDDAYSDRLRALVDAHYPLPMQNAGTSPIQDFLLFIRYLKLLRQVKPDVLLTYTIKPNIYGGFAAQLLGIPSISNVSGLGTAFIRDSWLTRVVKQLYRFAFRGVRYVFFQNDEDRALFVSMRLVAPEKTRLLPGSGVDIKRFHPIENVSRNDGSICFLLMARLLWDKGIGEYVEAARQVKALYPNAIFRLAGPLDVQNKTAIPSAVVEGWVNEKTIDYLGETDDARGVIAQHDCVVLPSYREGLSRVLLEAAAMAKPLIATDVPGCRQVVEAGRNGLLCRARDADDLAKTMIEFIRLSPEARAQMGAESRVRAEQEFDEKLVFEAYLEALRSLIL